MNTQAGVNVKEEPFDDSQNEKVDIAHGIREELPKNTVIVNVNHLLKTSVNASVAKYNLLIGKYARKVDLLTFNKFNINDST